MRLLGSNPAILFGGQLTIHVGDVRDRLRDMPDESVDVVVTSPPYWGVRDYSTAVWVEGDPACAHQPIATTRTAWASTFKGPIGQRTLPGYREPSRARNVGGYCSHCGAKRVDYQIGLEATLGEHIDVMVDVFAEIHRVLKRTGSVWMNYGDCYAAEPNGRKAAVTRAAGNDDRTFRDKPFSTVGPIYDRDYATPRGVFEGHQWNEQGRDTRRVDHGGRVVAGGVLKPKDLCMIPNRLAIALQEWGWWVRSEIIWGKTNPMPDSSGNGRPSTSHEKVFLLTKSADADVWRARDTGELSFNPDHTETCAYTSKRDPETGELMGGARRWLRIGSWYDASAVMQPSSPQTHARAAQNIAAQQGSRRANGGTRPDRPMKTVTSKIVNRNAGHRANDSYNAAMMSRDLKRGLTPRQEGQVNHTGLGRLGRDKGRLLRNFELDAPLMPAAELTVWPIPTVPFKGAHFATFPPQLVAVALAAACPPVDGVVLHPFGGAGTVALVAMRMGRRAHLIELKPDYVELTIARIEEDRMGPDERRRAQGKRRGEALAAAGALPPLPLAPLPETLEDKA